MKIGIEVELHSEEWSADYIAEQEGLNFDEFTYLKGMDVGVKLSREYYSSTIEYNFTPFENSLESFKQVREFLNEQISKYNLYKHCDGPAYVGTHIHIFDEDKINMRISNLLEGVAGFLINNISSIDKKGIQRLLFAHQLWGNFSWNNSHIWKEFLNSKRKCPSIYDNTREKPKYNPIIFSLANNNTGKPKSLEIRLIPNEFIFNLKAYELMSLIEKRELSKNKKTVIELYNVLYESLYGKIEEPTLTSTGNFTSRNYQESFISDTTSLHFFNNRIYSNDDIETIIKFFRQGGSLNFIITHENINIGNYQNFINMIDLISDFSLLTDARKLCDGLYAYFQETQPTPF